jgi:hypothetical protein
MRVQTQLRLPGEDTAQTRHLTTSWAALTTQLNQLSEGQVVAATNAATAAPTGSAVNYNQGDFIRNSTPVVAGTAGSRYVVMGWVCVAAGAPGTWAESRTLTGT